MHIFLRQYNMHSNKSLPTWISPVFWSSLPYISKWEHYIFAEVFSLSLYIILGRLSVCQNILSHSTFRLIVTLFGTYLRQNEQFNLLYNIKHIGFFGKKNKLQRRLFKLRESFKIFHITFELKIASQKIKVHSVVA